MVLTFNPAHPEGSHTLRLAVPAERSIAVLMCNLDQASTFDLIRNIRLDGKALGGTVKKLRWPTRWAGSAHACKLLLRCMRQAQTPAMP